MHKNILRTNKRCNLVLAHIGSSVKKYLSLNHKILKLSQLLIATAKNVNDNRKPTQILFFNLINLDFKVCNLNNYLVINTIFRNDY